ncbi:MAG TPA: hypothetical protein VKM72_13150 [Thermoanaerobaculia bacterium]|nr:hypothetical protein [Thermoanaerobaculia bacterium]
MNKAEFEKGYARRRKIAGVFGGGESRHATLATPIGELIARKGFHLLTGGGGGVMAQVSEAFYQTQPRKGLVLGIIRAGTPFDQHATGDLRPYEPRSVNDWVEIPIYTHLPLSGEHGKELGSRNHVNVLTADVAIVLPGGTGTGSEVELALEYGIPVIFYLGDQKIGAKEAGDYLARYPGRRAVDAQSISDVEAELDRFCASECASSLT